MRKSSPTVTAVMPVYQEERDLPACMESLLGQDYPRTSMEWIFVDGGSKDQTRAILKRYQEKYPNLIRILHNPHRTVPYAMNIGIAAAEGRYLIRLDAHAQYAENYISCCVHCLDDTGADNVGGVMETVGRGRMGEAISRVLSSRFGVGNSRFRTHGKSGYVDTVPFGAFRREVFEKWGGYDERLSRNQDNELNARIRKNGGKIYLDENIHLTYFCRDSVKSLAIMAIENGKWNVITGKLCPGSMGMRHFVPFFFLLSLLLLIPLSFFHRGVLLTLSVELLLYGFIDIYSSVKVAKKGREIPLLFLLFPTFHLTYGWGSLWGLYSLLRVSTSQSPKRGSPDE